MRIFFFYGNVYFLRLVLNFLQSLSFFLIFFSAYVVSLSAGPDQTCQAAARQRTGNKKDRARKARIICARPMRPPPFLPTAHLKETGFSFIFSLLGFVFSFGDRLFFRRRSSRGSSRCAGGGGARGALRAKGPLDAEKGISSGAAPEPKWARPGADHVDKGRRSDDGTRARGTRA